jgi:hypothetical protein
MRRKSLKEKQSHGAEQGIWAAVAGKSPSVSGIAGKRRRDPE